MLVTPLDQIRRKEPVAFDQLMEGLLVHAMKGRLHEEALKRLRGLGVDMARPLLSAYPLMTLLETVRLCSEVLHPELPREEARYRLGLRTLEGFGSTGMGKALFGMARTWGPRRMLSHMTRVFQTGINYARAHSRDLPEGDMEVTVEVLPEFHAAISPRPGLDPHFVRGIIAQLMEVCGTPVPVSLVLPGDSAGLRFSYRVPLSQMPDKPVTPRPRAQ